MKAPLTKQHAAPLPDLPCACATARRAARLVSQLYGDHLRSYGLEASQFPLLAAVRERPGKSQTQLARILGLDKTTLSRNLKLMQANGWITSIEVEGQREQGIVLTPEGKKIVQKASPGWTRAQRQLQSAMTPTEWKAMWTSMRALTRVAHSLTSAP